jgi:hypothetical protein
VNGGLEMRLINLDEKIFVPIVDEQIGASYEVQMTVAEVFDRFFEGNMPEIVDAIPVEWMKHRLTMALKNGSDAPEQAIRYVLWLWEQQKDGEQEAHCT